jgi:hypothetical protein
MANWNGRGTMIMTMKPEEPALSPEENPRSDLHIWVLRVWMICALIIVAAGVANYLLSLFVGEK